MGSIRMRWLIVLCFVGSGSAGASEPDPRAEMARALEAQADVAPSPPRFPERASLDVKPPVGGEDVGKKEVRAAVRAAVKAALAEVAHGAKGAAPPPGQAARDKAESDHGNGPPPNHGHNRKPK